jgi:DNA processing protein
MTEREAIFAFNMIPSIGFVRLQKLMNDHGGSAVEAYESFPEKLDWEGKSVSWEKEMERAESMHVNLVVWGDKNYPARLLDNASPPLALYVVGNPDALSNDGVAMIGTRWATPYGISTAEKISSSLARKGWTVFSGLARGIDGASHRGALDGNGCTVGVLGGALDCFFPVENRELAREMVAKGGAVVSEFPFGRHPDNMTFPQRNRIVAALSRGVVAVECPLKSGTLITCSRAIEMNRSVMAVPGRVGDKASAGCLNLIRDGARMVTSAEDIIEEITPIGSSSKRLAKLRQVEGASTKAQVKDEPPKEDVKKVEAKITIEESVAMGAIEGETSIDALVRKTGIPTGKLMPLLVSLRLKGRVKFLPGNRIVRAP